MLSAYMWSLVRVCVLTAVGKLEGEHAALVEVQLVLVRLGDVQDLHVAALHAHGQPLSGGTVAQREDLQTGTATGGGRGERGGRGVRRHGGGRQREGEREGERERETEREREREIETETETEREREIERERERVRV